MKVLTVNFINIKNLYFQLTMTKMQLSCWWFWDGNK